MPEILRKLLSILLLLAIMVGMVPACGPSSASSDHSMDNAMLLALASHEQLELGQGDVSSSNIGGNLLGKTVSQPAAATKNNPNAQLSAIYAKFAESQSEGSASRIHFESKANEYALLADALTIARVRRAQRRGRGFQRFIRRLARAPVNVSKGVARGVGKLLKGTFRVTGTILAVAAEHIPRLARDYVMQKLRDLRDLAQGRINLTWDKIAEKIGLPFAIWLRSRIDPAFVRLRDRVVNRVLGKNKEQSKGEEGKEDEDVSTSEDEGDVSGEVKIEPMYGTWQIDAEGEPDDMGGYIKWDEYWTGLPSSFEDDCLVGPAGIHGATIFSDDAAFTFSFDLDEENLHGKVTGSFDWESEAESSEGTFDEEITNGWIRPAPDGSGWEFGGTVEIDMNISMSLRCVHRTMIEGETIISYYWREQSNPLKATATLSGDILQLVPGEGDEPDHLAPGGIMYVDASKESESLEMAIFCIDCGVPDDFPPPFKMFEGDEHEE